ncbi:MAG TPA: mevalonate kinase, partial [Bacilli bacterium]
MTSLSPQPSVGRAHGKLILIGEHSVVYGKPAIALPFPLVAAESVILTAPGALMIDCEYYRGALPAAPDTLQGLAACVKETLKLLGKPEYG